MYEKEQEAWGAMGNLMQAEVAGWSEALGSESKVLKVGCLDTIGAKRYGKQPNISGQVVYDLQKVLSYIAPGTLPDAPDGAFGKNTEKALHHVLNQTTFIPIRDLGMLAALLSKQVVEVLEKPPASHADPSGDPGPQGKHGEAVVCPPMEVEPRPEFWSQVDPRWKDEKMGVDLPFRRGGCGIACMAMLFNWMELHAAGASETINPKDVDAWMDNHMGYAPGTNLIIWKNLERFALDQLNAEVIYQQDGSKDAPLSHEVGMARARDYLTRRAQPIILRVQNRQFNGGNWFNHFVLGYSIKENGEIGFMDPRNMRGGDANDPQNDTAQTVNKGGYNVVGIEQFILKELMA